MSTNNSEAGRVKNLLADGQAQAALDCAQKYLDANAQDPTALALLALALKSLNRKSEASEYFDRALKLGLEDEEGLSVYSEMLFEQSQFHRATEVLTRLTRLVPANATYLSNLGYLCHLTGNQAEAIMQCEAALKLDASCIAAYCNLGTALLAQGDKTRALESYQRGFKVAPGDSKLHTGVGLVYQQLGRFTDSINSHNQAITLDPHCIEAYCNLGIAQMNCMEAANAAENFKQALRLNPNYAAAKSNLQLTLQYLPEPTPRPQRNSDSHDGVIELTNTQKASLNGNKPLKIGFVSADLYKHPVGYFLRGLFRLPRRSGYEFYCYANQTIEDSLTRGN